MANPAAAPAAKQKSAAAPAAVEVTYTPGREDPVSVTWNKIVFEANKPRMVNDPRIVERAKRNPWFKVEGEKQADKGYDPATDTPVNSTQYRAYAITWLKTVKSSSELTTRWSKEEELRATCDVGTDDLDYIARHYDPRLEELRKMEAAGEAQ